jgi:hypothetical protein
MNLNQEFHEHLQAGRLIEAISLVVGQLVELKITTKASSGNLHTTVDLLQGQIINTVDPAFFSDKSSQKLLEFHTNQITATSQVVREQLRSLQDLLQALATPEVSKENISPTAVTSSEALISVDSKINMAANSPVVPAIISVTSNETPPVAVADEVVPAIQTQSIEEILAAEQPSITTVPELLVTQAAENPPISPTAAPVGKLEEQPAIAQPLADLTEDSNITDSAPQATSQAPDPIFDSAAAQESNQSERVKLPDFSKPESPAEIASGLAAVLAQTSAPDPAEAATIPNKFDQALRSAGVRSTTEEDPPPFAANQSLAEPKIQQSAIEQPTDLIPKRELIDLLQESEEDWDEWLLEEDNIFSELSDVTKDKLPDLESHWLSAAAAKSSPTDWDEFMPEYPEVNKNQANVERFRQNFSNDPQLMRELLAELEDNLKEEGKSKH